MLRVVPKSITFIFFCLFGVCILFLLLEGLCSSLYVIRDFVSLLRRASGPTLSQYDPELGWVNAPNFYSKDFYRPGVYVQTNSKGFRNQEEFAVQVPARKLRVICSGDSFTFGVGVDNDHTWCEQLASADHRLQTVNMGVGGYGVDQIYLMHLREGERLDYDVQILAVIADDFNRMETARLLGYAKPMLQLHDGQLVATHVPVPKTSAFSRSIFWSKFSLYELRSVELLLHKSQPSPPSVPHLPPSTREVAARIIGNLQAANQQKRAVMVVVYLARLDDLAVEGPSETWRSFLRDESAKRGLAFIDLTPHSQQLPYSQVAKLYIPFGLPGSGHLTNYGHEYVSRKVYQALTADPEVSARLSGLRSAVAEADRASPLD